MTSNIVQNAAVINHLRKEGKEDEFPDWMSHKASVNAQ